ncbi:MAG: hypothetical protein EOP84_02560 [Verrucomicrobiaceae bacterium]|nr:MAG: hypothetical protein EOP84_02560 [Verrucomicrobiaceae bacterium]
MKTPIRVPRYDVNWDSAIEKALENHLRNLLEHHRQIWPTIVDQSTNFFDTAPALLTPPSAEASEHEWRMYDLAAEEMFFDWEAERLRLDYEIPYFHLTSLFVHICSSTEGWLSSLCDLLASYHGVRITHRHLKSEWALSAKMEFLESVLNLDLGLPSDLKQRIRSRFSTRNAIVHSPPLFHYSPPYQHPEKEKLTRSGAFSTSRDGNLRFNEPYLLKTIDDSIQFSQSVAAAI